MEILRRPVEIEGDVLWEGLQLSQIFARFRFFRIGTNTKKLQTSWKTLFWTFITIWNISNLTSSCNTFYL